MEYFCQINKNNHSGALVFGYTTAVLLPLYNLEIERCEKVPSNGYYIQFLKEDRYTPSLIDVWPPAKITEEQFRIINEK